MIVTRQSIVDEARTWVGTPYREQGRLKHVACDCIGLIWKVGEATGALAKVDPLLSKPFLGYGSQPNPAHMRQALEMFAKEITADEAGEGDFVWIQWREGLPQHLAIMAVYDERITLIHSSKQFNKVAEHGFTQEWRDKVNSYWRYPRLEQDV